MSPVHDQSYRRYEGQRVPVGRAWSVILRTGARSLVSRKVFIALLLLSWLPLLVRSVQIYVVTAYPQTGQVLPINLKLFQSFIEFQGLFAFFITVYAGAGLIASDRRARALQVYLSKPLLRMEYIGGKLGILMLYLSLATIVPSVLLILMQVVLSGSLDFVTSNPTLVPAVLLASSIRVIVPAFTMLGLSALSTSTRYVAVMYAGVVFFSQALYGVLTVVTGSTRVAWVSIPNNFDVVTDAIFRQPPRYETPVIVSVLVLVCLVVLSVSVLERQVRGVEIVS
jgi:ABC-type transport system involved in multi-copper enzyme maturation permease subunit